MALQFARSIWMGFRRFKRKGPIAASIPVLRIVSVHREAFRGPEHSDLHSTLCSDGATNDLFDAFGVHPKLIEWVRSFLTHRSFKVRVHDALSLFFEAN